MLFPRSGILLFNRFTLDVSIIIRHLTSNHQGSLTKSLTRWQGVVKWWLTPQATEHRYKICSEV